MMAAGDTFRAAAVEQLQRWGERVQAPVIAQQTGAALMGAATTFEGSCLRVVVGEPIPLRAGAEGAEQMGQELAEFFTTQVSAKPTDWHMMQKFFPGVVA